MNCRSGVAERILPLVKAVCSMDGKVVGSWLVSRAIGRFAGRRFVSFPAPMCSAGREACRGDWWFSVTDACMNAALKGIRIVLNGFRKSKVPMPQGDALWKTGIMRVDRMTKSMTYRL